MTLSVTEMTIQQRLSLPAPDPETFDKIRSLWITHSKAEDARSLDGLISTLSENCVYEIMPTGQRWEGHAGARNFYLSFLGAFPDVHFDMYEIVIGPQGVFEVAKMTGTHKGEWAGLQPTGKRVETDVIIYFPWNAKVELFDGERIWFDRMALQLE
ncbi:MAG TPA: ester cyclase [Phototrophicaceae bacterium]|nr:ester cyclase [Phototrophicaceae bacterium]